MSYVQLFQTLYEVIIVYYYYFLPEEVGHRFTALNGKLAKLTLCIGCPSQHLTSWMKLALIQKLLVQLPKAFYEHGSAGKPKTMKVIPLLEEESE